jgi:hypothetical protein
MASVNCTPAVFSLMECMQKNENNPLACVDAKRAVASCVAAQVQRLRAWSLCLFSCLIHRMYVP